MYVPLSKIRRLLSSVITAKIKLSFKENTFTLVQYYTSILQYYTVVQSIKQLINQFLRVRYRSTLHGIFILSFLLVTALK